MHETGCSGLVHWDGPEGWDGEGGGRGDSGWGGLQPTRLLHPWDSLGKSTGAGCHHLLRLFALANTKSLFRGFTKKGLQL